MRHAVGSFLGWAWRQAAVEWLPWIKVCRFVGRSTPADRRSTATRPMELGGQFQEDRLPLVVSHWRPERFTPGAWCSLPR